MIFAAVYVMLVIYVIASVKYFRFVAVYALLVFYVSDSVKYMFVAVYALRWSENIEKSY